jgi:hypothetical protein
VAYMEGGGLMHDTQDVTGIDFRQPVLSLQCSVQVAVARKQEPEFSVWLPSAVRGSNPPSLSFEVTLPATLVFCWQFLVNLTAFHVSLGRR